MATSIGAVEFESFHMDALFLPQRGGGLGFVQSSLKDRRGYDRLDLPS
jgi:hypothetical protein